MIPTLWDTEIFPEDWSTAVICPIFKKGDLTKAKNYRCISLQNTCYKVFTSLLLERINQYFNGIVGDTKVGLGEANQLWMIFFHWDR